MLNKTIRVTNNLDEVSLIRPILIGLLVLYHSFAPYCDAWEPFEGYRPCTLYWWIGKAAYSFMLPMFVFISGYVWSYQREVLQKRESLTDLINKKFKRLIIPSIIFSTAYLLIFDRNLLLNGSSITIWISIIVDIISGYAHMWFLPMLFWTFVISYLILQKRIVLLDGLSS